MGAFLEREGELLLESLLLSLSLSLLGESSALPAVPALVGLFWLMRVEMREAPVASGERMFAVEIEPTFSVKGSKEKIVDDVSKQYDHI